ncbi:MAG TPA: CPBP family intramembrane glutamic endopeptidase [bacterium]|nr:CPBP family intramembrane glutamic endopeptidase [bacterium]
MSARETSRLPVRRMLVIPLTLAALMLRPPGTLTALALVAAAGAIGLLTPLPPAAPVSRRRWLIAVGVGIATFGAARVVVQAVPAPSHAWAVLGASVAAVAEEAFFRRLLYGWLAAAWGVGVAVAASALLFALVHVPAYGLISIPLNVAAGLLFGWQRWTAGTWTAPALTHVAANLLQMNGVFVL